MIGVDIVEVAHLREIIQRRGDRFLRRIFREEELSYCMGRRDPYPHLAARFALKEAFFKALGTGLSGGITWKDVGVGEDRALYINGRAKEILGDRSVEFSLSHTPCYAVAVVLISTSVS